MLFQIIEENGVKKIQALTADAGAGNPVGTIIPMYKKSSPSGYLFCDGSTFDQTAYPLLYAYLGTNVLPDYREFALVGAEQNTTSSNITDHDVYAQGEGKDDQLQEHRHSINYTLNPSGSGQYGFEIVGTGTVLDGFSGNIYLTDGARSGTVTRGKRKAVYFYIKATSGLSENAQDNVINTLNEQRSYSTEEHPTGAKWIDGKPIYRKVVDCGALPDTASKSVAHNITNIGTIIKVSGTASRTGATIPLPYVSTETNVNVSIALYVTPQNVIIQDFYNMTDYTSTYVILEYTKTN